MNNNVSNFVETIRHFSSAEQREVLARLWTEQTRIGVNETWKTVKFSENLRVTSYDAGQAQYLDELREALQKGVLARLENQADGTFEIYGAARTFYVTMTIEREFAGLLSSWLPENPPREINLEGAQ
jgi:hypothetical protein